MATAGEAGGEQSALWNGPAGEAWVALQPVLDRMLAPFAALLAEAAGQAAATRVLDVGCGAGSTTLAVARRRGAAARCVGIDVSTPLIAAAEAQAARQGLPVRFVCDDAQTHAFEPARFDLILSRFGVMFFDDPVRAFANLRRAARAGASLRFVAWRSGADNPFMTTAERAAATLLPALPASDPHAPGQFAFAERARVQRILEDGGWSEVEIHPIDLPCRFAEQDLTPYLTRLGPLGRQLAGLDEATRTRVVGQVRAAFDPFVHGAEVRFTAACWDVRARAPGRAA